MTTKTHEELREELIEMALEDQDFRARLIEDPKATIKEAFGIEVPGSLAVNVHEDTATTAHLVLPPAAQLGEEDLSAVAAGHHVRRGAYDSRNRPHIHVD